MYTFWQLILLLVYTGAQKITASLAIIQYEPPIFTLQFSEAVQRPTFQLFYNSISQLNFTFSSAPNYSQVFQFQTDPNFSADGQTLQSFQVLFNYPLDIGGGRLSSASQWLTAVKPQVTVGFSPSFGIIAVMLSYFLLNFTVLGHIAIQFLQIYCLLMFRLELKTQLYQQMSKVLFLLNPFLNSQSYNSIDSYYIVLAMPTLLVVSTGLAGYLLRRWLWGQPKSVICRIFYQLIVYNLFLNVGATFSFSLLFNSVQFYILLQSGVISPNSTCSLFGQVFCYLNLALVLFFSYLCFYVMNPKPNQTAQSWSAYLQSQSFDNFRILHEIMLLSPWYKRNKIFLVNLKRFTMVLMFLWSDGFLGMVVLLEFVNIFFIFTVRPYKYEVYMNMAVICRVLVLMFYVTVAVGSLYFSLGPATLNYNCFKGYLLGRDILFLSILTFMFLFVIYQLHQKYQNLNYQIRLVREQNEFKLQFVQKEKAQADLLDKKKHPNFYIDTDDIFQGSYKLTKFQDSPFIRQTSKIKQSEYRQIGPLTRQRQASVRQMRHNSSLTHHSNLSKESSDRQQVNVVLQLQTELQGKRLMAQRELQRRNKNGKGRDCNQKSKSQSLLDVVVPFRVMMD